MYTLDPGRAQALSFTRVRVTGWEPTVRTRTPGSSALALVRGAECDTVGDVVLLTAGQKEATFARWSGRLSRSVPEQIAEAVETGGPDAFKRELTSLTDQSN